MQFIDLKRQYSIVKNEIDDGIRRVLDSGMYIMGPEIKELEQLLAEFTARKHCVVCSSGTDALQMPLMAWNIGPGDAVFTTPFTFIATAEVISLVGATPVFVDIKPDTYNIDPDKLDEAIEKVKAEGKLIPRAIIPVDLFGLPADYDEIEKIAKKHNLLILEDAAQGFGGNINGKKSGSYGDAAATSFFPAKPLGCYGDGGAIFTDDDDLYEKLISIRVHGMGTDRYENVRIGLNARMDSMQAAVLIAKMKIFEGELEQRNVVASKYTSKLKDKLVTPYIPQGYFSCWAQYCLQTENSQHRAEIQARLKDKGVPTAIYYPIPLHLQKAFAGLGYNQGDFPISEAVAERIFAIPMHPYITDEEIDLICENII